MLDICENPSFFLWKIFEITLKQRKIKSLQSLKQRLYVNLHKKHFFDNEKIRNQRKKL